jgi:lipoprotein-releasing system permease protein
LARSLLSTPGVEAIAPLVQGEAMITNSNGSTFALVNGIDPAAQTQVSPIADKMIQGALSSLHPKGFGVVLGIDMANQLGLSLGQQVTLIVPRGNLSPFGLTPVMRQFTVVGIFKTGYQFDSNMALIDLSDAQRLFDMPGKYSSWQLKCRDLFQAPSIARTLNQTLQNGAMAQDWTTQNQTFFQALAMEKTMMFLILTLIIAVAVFNMLSSLVMLVTDKRAEIAILRTMGMQTREIMTIFVVQGTLVGLIGIVLGTLAGIGLSLTITSIVNHLQVWLGVQFLNSSVYYIDFLPSNLRGSDVWHIDLLALGLSVLATLYPAWRASKIQPAEALRYE